MKLFLYECSGCGVILGRGTVSYMAADLVRAVVRCPVCKTEQYAGIYAVKEEL